MGLNAKEPLCGFTGFMKLVEQPCTNFDKTTVFGKSNNEEVHSGSRYSFLAHFSLALAFWGDIHAFSLELNQPVEREICVQPGEKSYVSAHNTYTNLF